MATIAPMKEDTGISTIENELPILEVMLIKSPIRAPSKAPEAVPVTYGSASGFLNSDCITAPATDRFRANHDAG
jgi:hypothetical protein